MLTRFAYHATVAAWLLLLCAIDVIANTFLEGIMSDVYFYKVFLDLALIWWTVMFIREDLSGTIVAANSTAARNARAAQAAAAATLSDRGRAEVVHVDLGKSEYIYYGFLTFYGLGNLFFHHAINKSSTGFLSFGTLIISIADMVVTVVAIVNFWQVASGKIVRLSQEVARQLNRSDAA